MKFFCLHLTSMFYPSSATACIQMFEIVARLGIMEQSDLSGIGFLVNESAEYQSIITSPVQLPHQKPFTPISIRSLPLENSQCFIWLEGRGMEGGRAYSNLPWPALLFSIRYFTVVDYHGVARVSLAEVPADGFGEFGVGVCHEELGGLG